LVFLTELGYQPQLRALAEWLLFARVVLWFVHRVDGGGGRRKAGRLEGDLLWESGRRWPLHLARTRERRL
jgi:hypothetical protein